MNAIISLTIIGVLALFSGLINLKKLAVPVAALGLLVALAFNVLEWNHGQHLYNNMVFFDNFALAFSALICVISFVIVLLNSGNPEKTDIPLPETIALTVFATIGALVMVSFSNLTMLFIGIEILSVSLYIMAGAKKRDYLSNEASLKYLIMGAFATGFLLFGIALIYGVTGSFDLEVIKNFTETSKSAMPGIYFAGIILLLIGLSFKISAVPFQFWTPDVYQGAPSLTTAFMATVVKTAGVAALYRLFSYSFAEVWPVWTKTLMVLSALTMTVGNISAVMQNSFKRMLAYSSIAHAGYFLLAVFSLSSISGNAILLYSAAYSFATIIAFVGLIIVVQKTGDDSISSFNGLAKKNPLLAFGITLAMCSLAGIPPAAGFMGKFFIFSSAVSQNYIWMVVLAVINSAIGLYYYFKVIMAMYMKEPENELSFEFSGNQQLALLFCIIATLALGIMPSALISLL